MPDDTLSTEFAQAGGRTLLRLAGRSHPVNEVLPTEEECPTGNVQFTVKFVNNNEGCEDNTAYYTCRYSTSGGEESTSNTVGEGATSTLPITAHDGDQDGAADSVLLDYSVFDPDPILGCNSGSVGGENFLQNGDTWTLTLNADGTLTDEITPAPRAARSSKKSTAAREPLKPIPDPRFSGR